MVAGRDLGDAATLGAGAGRDVASSIFTPLFAANWVSNSSLLLSNKFLEKSTVFHHAERMTLSALLNISTPSGVRESNLAPGNQASEGGLFSSLGTTGAATSDQF